MNCKEVGLNDFLTVTLMSFVSTRTSLLGNFITLVKLGELKKD